MTKYKVIKKFLGGPEVRTVLESGYSGTLFDKGDLVCTIIEAQLLLDGGYIEEVDGKWMPEMRTRYYYIGWSGSVFNNLWAGSVFDLAAMRFGNIFQTEADALKARDAIKELLKQI